MEDTTIAQILGDFSPATCSAGQLGDRRKPVTLWLSPEDKARYENLQRISGRKFAKKAREALLKLIELAELRAG